MPKQDEQRVGDKPHGAPRPWASGEEFEQEARIFFQAAQRYVGRGQPERNWCEAQRLLMKLATVIESAGWTEDWIKTLQHMINVANKSPAISELRCQAVQVIDTLAAAWKLPKWQASYDVRRQCLMHLVSALEALDNSFALFRHDLDAVASKLDTYVIKPGDKSAARILAELIVEGADALGFTVEPNEPPEAETKRIQRQLERDGAAHSRRARVSAN